MTLIDRVLSSPRLLEVESVDLAVSPSVAWELVRHGDLARSPAIRALFSLRTLPGRLAGRDEESPTLAIDELRSTTERPGFQILHDDPPRELVVGAIGKVWHLDIPFVHVPTAEAFAAFDEPGFVKVAWAIQIAPRGERDSRVSVELRVDATDESSWQKFKDYFRLIGAGSRFIRRSFLSSLARAHGTPESKERSRPAASDALLPDAAEQLDHGVTIRARPDEVWPWLVQMGGGRAGFYSIDLLDNAGVRSAREIHADLQDLRVGDVIPATPHGTDGFEVLSIEPNSAFVLGSLFDADAQKQLPFASPRPPHYWQVTWAFTLEPLDEATTRLHVRARAAFPESEHFHASWIRPVHYLMETAQLEHLAARAEGRLAKDDWRDVTEGVGGAAVIAAAFLTPFMRRARSHWGLDEATAARSYAGDELVPEPAWSWTHGVEIDAPAEQVWPWVAQIGAERGGFYSYQWLENVAGCEVRNAESVHPEWFVHEGGTLSLHPKAPPLKIVSVAPGRHFVAYGPPDEAARAAGKPWVAASWAFFVEPLGDRRCRFISRYRVAMSDELATRISFGPLLIEPIGFAMDRRMLIGVKDRAERAARAAEPIRFSPPAESRP